VEAQEKEIIQVVANVLEVPFESLGGTSSPETVESWDSLKHMKLVLALEEHFEIEMTESDVVEMLSVELIILSVRDRLPD
jgi:acyl carrier protein